MQLLIAQADAGGDTAGPAPPPVKRGFCFCGSTGSAIIEISGVVFVATTPDATPLTLKVDNSTKTHLAREHHT